MPESMARAQRARGSGSFEQARNMVKFTESSFKLLRDSRDHFQVQVDGLQVHVLERRGCQCWLGSHLHCPIWSGSHGSPAGSHFSVVVTSIAGTQRPRAGQCQRQCQQN